MDRLKMAHDWAMKSFVANGFKDEAERAICAWRYADAMQAEADKRNKAEAAQKRKEIREMLNDANTFVEREGQHFDDVADIQKPYTSSEEWQPDWSQAPGWANWWAIQQGGSDALWCVNKPTVTEDCFLSHGGCGVAPSFGFTGTHIVERPHGF